MIPYSNSPGYSENFDPQMDDDGKNIRRYLSLFISNWYWFVISLFIAVTIAYGINRYGEKIFTVSSTLLIKDDQNGGGLSYADNFIPGSNVFKSQQNLKNEIGILKSFSLNLRVIDSLPEFRIVYYGVGKRNIVESTLYKNCPFEVVAEPLAYQPRYVKIVVKITSGTEYVLVINGSYNVEKKLNFGEKFNSDGFNFIIKLRDAENFSFNPEISNKYYFYFSAPEALTNIYRRKLNVTPIDQDATLLNLSVSGSVQEQEADYLNKLMELYISQGLEAKNQIADSTIIFIDRQLRFISDSLKKAEDNLQEFRLENKLVDLSKEGTLIQGRLEQFENEKTTLGLQYQYYQYLKEYLESKNELGDIVSPSVMGVTDQELGRLIQDLAGLQLKKKQMSMNLSLNTPPSNLLEENILNIRNALKEYVESSLKNLERSINDVYIRIEQVNREIIKLPGTERKMISIQRKFDINNTVYTYLLEKRAEAGIAKASSVSNSKIIDWAEVYNSVQVKPKNAGNKSKAFILGLLVPGILISLLYYFNNMIIDNVDIVKRTKVPIIGYISHTENKEEIQVIENPGSTISESFRSVRTSLRYFIKDTGHPVIAVTSTISSEGKTFISVNLAAVIAMLGKKVLLIGLDLRKPRIHRILGIDNSEGMSTYLSNNCEYEDVIKETVIENLFYAPSGPIPPNPSELINDERMRKFIEIAKSDYDFIIIDTPPVAVVSDTLLLADFTDINIFVVRQRFSSKNTLELIQELYQTEKIKNMGIIINDISLTGYYGYGLRYGYYKGYGYSYGKNYYGQYSYSKYGYTDKEKGYYV